MRRPARIRIVTTTALGTGVLLSLAACGDLFHATDFATLCSFDAEACASEAGSEGGTPSDAGAEASDPTPIDLCASSSAAARELAERACGWLGACLGTLEDSRLGPCMMRALAAYDCSFNPSLRPLGALAAQWQCLSNVTSCSEVDTCIYGNRAPTRCTPKGSGTYTACDPPGAGIVTAECGNSETPLGISPCTLRGRTCALVDESKSICAGKRGAACTGGARCEDTFAVSCKSAGGIASDEGTDCATVGDGRCASDSAGAACAPPADAGDCAFAKTTKIACNSKGTLAESCVDGRSVTMNCAAIGQGCSASNAIAADPTTACANLDAGTACTSTEDDCDGGVLSSCAQGMPFVLPCTKIGLDTCEKVAGRQATCKVK